MSIAKWLLAKKLGGGSPFPPVIKRATGNPIEITDGASAPMVKCVTQITGSQDLHGYDKPWVGGAGKNKYSGTDKSVNREIVVTLDNDLPSGIWFFSAIIDCNNPENTLSVVFRDANNNTLGAIYITHDSTTRTYAGANITAPIHSLILRSGSTYTTAQGYTAAYTDIMLESGAYSGSYAPYSNICPITAYTEGEIVVRGRNIASPSPIEIGQYVNGNFVYFNARITSDYMPIQPNKPYTASIDRDNINDFAFINYAYFDKDKTFLGDRSVNGEESFNGQKTHTCTIHDSKAAFLRYTIRAYSDPGIDISGKTLTNAQFMVEKGSTATTYEPYTATTHTTTYPSAIYRGSEDVVNGEVTTEKKCVDFSSLEWTLYGPNLFYVDLADKKNAESAIITDDILCSNYEPSPVNDVVSLGKDFSVGSSVRNGRVFVRDSRCSTVTEFNAVNTTSQLVYVLATPTTSSVTPTNLPIKSLSGYNHIESSTGDMVVDYITDAYQNFVDTVESALPNTRKGGTKAMDIFLSLEKKDDKKEEVKEETKDDMR